MCTKKTLAKGWTPDQLESLQGNTYVITGANSGTGFQAARILVSKGAGVVMMNRSVEKSEAAIAALKQEFGREVQATFVRLDLASLDSVRKASAEVLATLPRIDALICNGAIAQVARQEFTQDGFESHLGVNHYGHFLLCGLLYQRIDDSNGRIVVVGSEGYKMGIKTIQFDDMNWNKNYHPNSTYCHSKLAQMIFAYELQRRTTEAGKNIKVYVCHPGASRTSLINEKANVASRLIFSLMAKSPMVQTAERGAYPEVMCATTKNLEQQAYYGPSGLFNWIGPVGKCEIKPFVWDRAVAEKLWAVSEKETSIGWQI